MSTKPMMDSIVEAVENERTRIDLVLRRADASAAESYGQLKKVFCRVQKKTKPMGKTMMPSWLSSGRSAEKRETQSLSC